MTDLEIAERLLTYLHAETGVHMTYAKPPRRITGGFDTRIYDFRLERAPEALAAPLILRLFREDDDPQRAGFEAAIQNFLESARFPAPKVLLACVDRAILGGGFMIMERVPGRPMLKAIVRPGLAIIRFPRLVARQQRALHCLDTSALVARLKEEAFDGYLRVPDAWLDDWRSRIQRAGLSGLVPALGWLEENRPPAGTGVICHGDFHPLNLMMDRGQISGVLDWAWVTIADPAWDVGATKALMGEAPAQLPSFLGPAVSALRRRFVGAYLGEYMKGRALDSAKIDYYEATRCLGFLIEAGEYKQAAFGAIPQFSKPVAFVDEPVLRQISGRMQEITGLTLSLPDRHE